MAAAELMLHGSPNRGIQYDTGSSYLVVMRQNNQGWLDFLCSLLNDCSNVSCITVDSVCKEMKIPLYTSFVQFVLYPVQVGLVSSVNTQCACKTCLSQRRASMCSSNPNRTDRGAIEQT